MRHSLAFLFASVLAVHYDNRPPDIANILISQSSGAALDQEGTVIEMVDESNIQVDSDEQPFDSSFIEPEVPDSEINFQELDGDISESDDEADQEMV